MKSPDPLKKYLTLLLFAFVLVSLACNLPVNRDEIATKESASETPSQDQDVPPEQATRSAPQTAAAIGITATAAAVETSGPPTFTAIGPTLAATFTRTPTPRPTSTRTATPKGTETAEAGTATAAGNLRFDYLISWIIDPDDPFRAVATVVFTVYGGSGGYQYFHDEIPVNGPQFQFDWRTCKPKPGSLRVTDSSGHSVKLNYFSVPPCPTPTPLP